MYLISYMMMQHYMVSDISDDMNRIAEQIAVSVISGIKQLIS